MSLIHSPVEGVFDGPEVLTISPADLLATSDLHSGDDVDIKDTSLCYAILEFPDSYYPLKVPNVVIGRDVKIQRLMERSSDIWVDGKMVRKHPNKRKRSAAELELEEPEEDDSSDADSYYDSAPSVTLEEGTTLVGGIGGMQIHPAEEKEDEQFIAVHPPADERTGQIPGLTSISKKHLRICFKDQIGWTMEILGRNGAYLNDEHWRQDDEVLLQDKDRIMIVGLQIVFRLHGSLEWREGSSDEDEDDEELSEIGSETFTVHQTTENGTVEGKAIKLQLTTTQEDSSDDDEDDDDDKTPKHPALKPKIKLRLDVTPRTKPKVEKEKKPATEKPAAEKTPTEEKKPTAEKRPVSEKSAQDTEILLQSLLAPGEVRPERRGPGRPPKNGVMSKREMRARQKAVKAGLPYEDALSAKVKGQSKNSENDGDEGDADGEGRKRKKVRRSETAGEDGAGLDQSGAGSDDDSKKDLLTPKVPREPTPKEEDFPEERLQKPEGTYQALLHQVLSEAKTPMALQQIYEDVKKRWPYYRFRVQSNGWESSVRHNLQSNQCFMKAGKEGKGHLWTIDPNVPFEPKMKRASPPPHPPPYYHHGPSATGMQHVRPGVMHGQPTNGIMGPSPYAHPYPSPYGQQSTAINGQRPPMPAKPPGSGQYSSPYSPNTTAPGQHPRPIYQTPQTLANPPPGGGPLKSYAHPPVGYRPPLPGSLHGAQQISAPGTRPMGQPGPSANHPHGQPLPNQPVNRAQPQVQNPALNHAAGRASTSLGPQTAGPSQRANIQGPMRPQTQQALASSTNSSNDCSALEKVVKGQVPEIFTRFRENLRSMPGAVVNDAQERQINQQIDQTIEWIMQNANRTDFATCEVVDQPDSVKATVRILRQMLYDDHRTFKSRTSGTSVPRTTSVGPGQHQSNQTTPFPRAPGPSTSGPQGILAPSAGVARPLANGTLQRPPVPQKPLARVVPHNQAASAVGAQQPSATRPATQAGGAPIVRPAANSVQQARTPQQGPPQQGPPQLARPVAPVGSSVAQVPAVAPIPSVATNGQTVRNGALNGSQPSNAAKQSGPPQSAITAQLPRVSQPPQPQSQTQTLQSPQPIQLAQSAQPAQPPQPTPIATVKTTTVPQKTPTKADIPSPVPATKA